MTVKQDWDKRIIRVFPRKTCWTPTDGMAFVGDPPLVRPMADEVHISVTFTWDIPEAVRLLCAWGQYYQKALMFGPAFGAKGDGFVPGLYLSHGVTFTSRGCNNCCGYCEVWKRDGKLRESDNFPEGNTVQDDNLLQCSQQHIGQVMTMLKKQRLISFTGGLDKRLLTNGFIGQLKDLDIFQLFFSCDMDNDLPDLKKALSKLGWLGRDKHGLIKKVRCYVLLAYKGESIEKGIRRLERVFEAGALPFAQLYQPPDQYINYPKVWRDLARQWSRPAITKSLIRGK